MITLLGPQHTEPMVADVIRELGAHGPAAVITAGWQEREDEPASLPELGIKHVNLALHARGDDVFRKDPVLSAAKKGRQARLKLMQDFYRIRLDHADQAARAISVRHVDPRILADERAASLAAVRRLDTEHIERCRGVRHQLSAELPAADRDAVRRHRRELAALIAHTDLIVIAGGHIAVLLNRIRLFGLAELFGGRPILAWSAGAMVLTERVVLFHDNPPHGRGIAEVLDEGLGLVNDLVVLPEPRLRLRLDDRARVAEYAGRFAPATCVAMDRTARITVRDGKVIAGEGIDRLTETGLVDSRWHP
jgi:peptidase E